MKPACSTHVVEIGEHGLLTLAVPRLAGQFVVVEQKGSQVVITPFDLESETVSTAIARRGSRFTLLGAPSHDLPEA